MFWLKEIRYSNLLILGLVKVYHLEYDRFHVWAAVHRVHLHTLVPCSRMLNDWWILFIENGCLECRLHSILTLRIIPFISRQILSRPNFNNIQYIRNPIKRITKKILTSCIPHEIQFLTNIRYRFIDTHEWCTTLNVRFVV